MMSTTSVSVASDIELSSTEPETSHEQNYRQEKRLFWSDGHVIGEKITELEVPGFNSVESGYLADDESENEDDDYEIRKCEVKSKKRSSGMTKSSSLFFSDSDGFEERAVL